MIDLMFRKVRNQLDKVMRYTDLNERKCIMELIDRKQLFYISQLIPLFENKSIYTFGTGGSVRNLNNLEKLSNKNLMTVTTAPLHFQRIYNLMPNIWYLHSGEIIDSILDQEGPGELDFANTFILVPSNDSYSKISFSSPEMKRFRKRHPEALTILYREKCRLHKYEGKFGTMYLEKGLEPIYGYSGSNVEGMFIPMSCYLGVKTIFFSGVDHLDTGHFWNPNEQYQSVSGKDLEFPNNHDTNFLSDGIIKRYVNKKIHVYRLEKTQTVLKGYEYVDFENSLELSCNRISADELKRNEA